MNERIRELYTSVVGNDKLNFDSHLAEKFAELIVRRCINIACEYDKPKLSGPGLAIACNIESHFNIYIEEDGRLVK